MLSACTGGTKNLHLDVFFSHFNINIRLNIRHHVTGNKGGLPLSLRIEGRNAYQSMNPRLRSKITVGILSHHFHGDRLDSGLISVQIVQNLYGKSVALRPAGIHPVKNARPVVRLCPACSGI